MDRSEPPAAPGAASFLWPFGPIQAEGRTVLGLATGLTPTAFAQAKSASLMADTGLAVSADGRTETWRCAGVAEAGGRMAVWGEYHPGKPLAEWIEGDDVQAAWSALAAAARAWRSAAAAKGGLRLIPAACMVDASGAVLFLPERLALRCLEALPERLIVAGLERWCHPDLAGPAAAAFSLAALAYRLACGQAAFSADQRDLVRADIRDNNVLPARLAKLGLDPAVADKIDAALGKTGAVRPSPADLAQLIEEAAAAPERLGTATDEAGRLAWEKERERVLRLRRAALGTKRFGRRNAAILTGGAAGLLLLILGVRGYLSDRAGRPSTVGMTPEQVAAAYYSGFSSLDHTLMDACVIERAGADDISAVVNLFVITRVRESYEHKIIIMTPEAWLAAEAPPADVMVFGATELTIDGTDTDASDGQVGYTASYRFWQPIAVGDAAPAGEAAATAEARPSIEIQRREDDLTLRLVKGAWRISGLERRLVGEPAPPVKQSALN